MNRIYSTEQVNIAMAVLTHGQYADNNAITAASIVVTEFLTPPSSIQVIR